MVDLGCQDTDRVSGNDKYILDAILLQDGLLKATLSMDKRNVNFWLVWGPERVPRVADG